MKIHNNSVPVADLMDEVKRALSLANLDNNPNSLKVSALRLAINSVAYETVGGGLDFVVPVIGLPIKLGGKTTRVNGHRIVVELAPPPAAHEIRSGEVQHMLLEAIRTIRIIMTSSASGEQPFLLNEGEVELSFAVTQEGTITLGLNGELHDETTHTLQLKFRPTTAQE